MINIENRWSDDPETYRKQIITKLENLSNVDSLADYSMDTRDLLRRTARLLREIYMTKIKQLNAFKTTDGKIFASEEEANIHQQNLDEKSLAANIESFIVSLLNNETDFSHKRVKTINLLNNYLLDSYRNMTRTEQNLFIKNFSYLCIVIKDDLIKILSSNEKDK